MDITYNELRNKEVINIVDGKRLGRICDLVIGGNSCVVVGIVVPFDRRLFRAKEDLFIPMKNIKRIGNDCILVVLEQQQFSCREQPSKPKPKNYCDYIMDDE